MTVHMFRVYVAPDISQSDLQTRLDDWQAQFTKWQDSRASDATVTTEPSPEVSEPLEYYIASIRFEQTDTKDNIQTKLGDKLKQKCDWYRSLYHECDHDGTADGCPWSEWSRSDWTAKNESIPADVPGDQVPTV